MVNMHQNKIGYEDMISQKRKEINQLSQKINRLKKEINQIEAENLQTLKKPLENNHKYKKVIQLFKRPTNKEKVAYQY